MERVISLLFDIENKANQIIEKANIEKTDLYEDNEKAIHEMETAIEEENNAKINIIMEQAKKELEKDIKQLSDNSSKQLADLDDNYTRNHAMIADKIFQNVITF